MMHSLNGCTGQAKARGQDLHLGLPHAGAQGFRPNSIAVPGAVAENWMKSRAESMWDTSVAGRNLT